MSDWYYSSGKEQMGPVDEAEFQRLSKQNIIRPETLVWRDGMAGWQPRRNITLTAPPGSILCAACGGIVPEADSFTLSGLTYCATCKPQVMQRIQEGKGLPAGNAEELRKAHIKHEASVKSVGLLYYLGGVALFGLGVSELFLGLRGIGRPTALLVGAAFLVLSVMEFVGGWGIRRLRPWARIFVGVVSGIGLFGFPVGTIISAYILHLVFSQKGAMLFTPEYHAAIAQTPHIRYRTSIVVWILLGLVVLVILAVIVAAATSHR